MNYLLSRKSRNNDRGWLTSTKGDVDYIVEVLRLSMENADLREFDWRIEKVD